MTQILSKSEQAEMFKARIELFQSETAANVAPQNIELRFYPVPVIVVDGHCKISGVPACGFDSAIFLSRPVSLCHLHRAVRNIAQQGHELRHG